MKVLIGVDPHKASVAVAAVDEAKGELLAPVSLFLLSQHHSTARPSAKRYDNRYEGEDPVRTSMRRHILSRPTWRSLRARAQRLCVLRYASIRTSREPTLWWLGAL
jgi:hypothetical protein